MKHFFAVAAAIFLFSCADSTTPFINHELKAEKIGNCEQQIVKTNMVSNTAGERYEFQYCLEDGFDAKNYTVTRKGDSIMVSFPVTMKQVALYKVTLDIDAKPAYHHIFLGQQHLEVSPAER
jgi:hypothetical protein